MQFTVQELAGLVGSQLSSGTDPTLLIRGAAAVTEAQEGDVTFLGNRRYLPALKASAASAALVPPDFKEDIRPIAIRVENPSLAFAQLLDRFAPEIIRFEAGVHRTATVASDVRLGDGVSVQPGAVIESGASIGERTVIGANCYVGHDVQIGADCHLSATVTVGARCVVGNRVILHSGVVVGSDGFGFEFVDGRHVKIPQTGIVQLDDDVEVGANTTIDRARFGRTWIGEGTKIDNLVQIAHNVVIGKHCIIVSQTGISGSTRLGNNVTVGGQSAFVGHIEVGDDVVIAARSGISKDVASKQVMWGSPVAMPMREAKEHFALSRRLPKLFDRLKRLEERVEDEKSTPPAT